MRFSAKGNFAGSPKHMHMTIAGTGRHRKVWRAAFGRHSGACHTGAQGGSRNAGGTEMMKHVASGQHGVPLFCEDHFTPM